MQSSGHKTWVEISGDRLKHNIQSIRSLLEPGVDVCAVVKANAYGHDLDTIVRLCSVEGIRQFAVDSIDEALAVQERTQEAVIFILGYTVPERLEEAVAKGFIINVYGKSTLDLLCDIARRQQTRARVNLKLETGTQRQGLIGSQLEEFLRVLTAENRTLELAGVSSHFANAEQASDPSFTEKQQERFLRMLHVIKQAGFTPTYVHTACSAAAILYPQTQYNMVRIGISLYGLWSDDSVRLKNRASAHPIDLRPIMRVASRVAQVKDVGPHQPIGYGCRFIAPHAMRIAVIPFGYYDGYQRGFSPKAEVLIHGQRCKVVGSICMNMLMVDVSQLPSVKSDDLVTLLGQNGMHRITAEDWAEWGSTINYEAVTHISSHLPRIVT